MKKKLKKPSIRTINHRDGGMSFYAEGGEALNGFKKRLMKRYPGMQGVYGSEGQNLNIIKDPNYAASNYGYGDIEFIHPGDGIVNYSDDYQYVSPTPDKYTAVFNPKGANRGDVFLDMMHGMRDDEGYMKLLNTFNESVKNARGDDMQYFYEQDAKNGYTDGQDQWNNNYIDGQLRAQLAPGTLGMFSHGRKDYRQERKFDTPEMRQAARQIRDYLKGRYEQGGELPKYTTQGQVGPSLFPAPSLAFQNKVQSFISEEDRKKLEEEERKKAELASIKNGKLPVITTTAKPKINASDNTSMQKGQPPSKSAAEVKAENDEILRQRRAYKEEAVRQYEENPFGDFTTAKSENLKNEFRAFPNSPRNVFDDYINPFVHLGRMAGNITSLMVPQDPNDPATNFDIPAWFRALGEPVSAGMLASFGATNNAQFINNLANPFAGFNPYKGLRNTIAQSVESKMLPNVNKVVSKQPVNSTVQSIFPSKLSQEQIKEMAGFLPRRQFVKNLQKEGLIGDQFKDLNYAARSTDKTNALTKLALDRRSTFYRGVEGSVPVDGKGFQEYTGKPYDMSRVAPGNDFSEFANMRIFGKVDFNDPISIARYQASHIPMEQYGYRSGFGGRHHGVDALYNDFVPTGYGKYQIKMRLPRDYSSGNYQDWFNRYYKPDNTFGNVATMDGGLYNQAKINEHVINAPYDMPVSLDRRGTTVVGKPGNKMFDVDETFPFENFKNLTPEQEAAFQKYQEDLQRNYNTGWAGQYRRGGRIELSNRMYEEGGEYELTNEEIRKLRSQGYDIELL